MPSPHYALRKQFESNSADETRAVGASIAAILPPQAAISLEGDLGAGKTTLVQGIASARARISPGEVTSPTFALIHEYGEPVMVYHVDLYRLESLVEAARLGLEELFERRALVLIEWANRFPQLLPPDHWLIRLEPTSASVREIHLYAPSQ